MEKENDPSDPSEPSHSQPDLSQLPPLKKAWLERGRQSGLRVAEDGILPMFRDDETGTKKVIYVIHRNSNPEDLKADSEADSDLNQS